MTRTDGDYLEGLLSRLQGCDRGAARALLEDAVRDHPADPRPLTLLAAQFVHGQEIDRAEACYIEALQRAPDFAIARFQLGLLQLTSARPAAAQATWALLDALPQTDPLRLFKTGLEAMAQDRFDEATRLLMQGIAQNQSNLPLNRDMQMVLEQIAKVQGSAGGPGDAAGEAQPQGHVLVSAYQKAN